MKNKFLMYEEIDEIIEDDSIYSEDVRDRLLDDDEISPGELYRCEACDRGFDGDEIRPHIHRKKHKLQSS